jgi:hypothetical protein
MLDETQCCTSKLISDCTLNIRYCAACIARSNPEVLSEASVDSAAGALEAPSCLVPRARAESPLVRGRDHSTDRVSPSFPNRARQRV